MAHYSSRRSTVMHDKVEEYLSYAFCVDGLTHTESHYSLNEALKSARGIIEKTMPNMLIVSTKYQDIYDYKTKDQRVKVTFKVTLHGVINEWK